MRVLGFKLPQQLCTLFAPQLGQNHFADILIGCLALRSLRTTHPLQALRR